MEHLKAGEGLKDAIVLQMNLNYFLYIQYNTEHHTVSTQSHFPTWKEYGILCRITHRHSTTDNNMEVRSTLYSPLLCSQIQSRCADYEMA